MTVPQTAAGYCTYDRRQKVGLDLALVVPRRYTAVALESGAITYHSTTPYCMTVWSAAGPRRSGVPGELSTRINAAVILATVTAQFLELLCRRCYMKPVLRKGLGAVAAPREMAASYVLSLRNCRNLSLCFVSGSSTFKYYCDCNIILGQTLSPHPVLVTYS